MKRRVGARQSSSFKGAVFDLKCCNEGGAYTADSPGPISGPSGGRSAGPLPERASALARGYPLAQGLGNPAAPGWAGANAPATGRQARADLTRVKSARKRWAGACAGAVPRLDAGHIRQEDGTSLRTPAGHRSQDAGRADGPAAGRDAAAGGGGVRVASPVA